MIKINVIDAHTPQSGETVLDTLSYRRDKILINNGTFIALNLYLKETVKGSSVRERLQADRLFQNKKREVAECIESGRSFQIIRALYAKQRQNCLVD